MPSFDVVNRIDLQEVDNAVNNAIKQIATRYDFRNVKTEIAFDRKEKKIRIQTQDSMKMDAVRETLLQAAVKRKLEIKAFTFSDPLPTTGQALKCEVTINEGIPQDIAKDIVKRIKETKIKVQASIQGEELRITGKQIDDLQAVIAFLREQDITVPLQFINFKS